MLTVEMLKQNASLSGLTGAQLGAIAEMSKNDENTVIGTKIGALHGQYDSDIFAITGLKKNDGEKSYDYAKRVLADYKNQISASATIQVNLANAKKEVETLKQKLAENSGDEVIKQQLKDAKAQVSQLQTKVVQKETEFKEAKKKFESSIKNIHVDYAFNTACSELKFKTGITENVKAVLLEAAKNQILSKGTPDFIDDGKGGKTLVLRGSDGNIINNPGNNLNPYTLKELLLQNELVKDSLDMTRKRQGGGTEPPSEPRNNQLGGNIDLSCVKNQIQADKAIEDYLISNGLTRDSAEFAQQSMQLRDENKVSELPIR